MPKTHVEKQLGESFYKNIVDNIDCGVVILKLTRTELDDYMEIEYTNDAFLEMIGLDRDEFDNLLDKRCMQFVDMEDLFEFGAIIAKLAENQDVLTASGKVAISSKDGKTIPTIFTARKQEDGKILCANIRC